MRKITSKRKEAKRQKRNQLIGSVVVIVLLVSSILGYSMAGRGSNSENKIFYEGYEFTENSGYWFVEKDGFEFSFRYKPTEISAKIGEIGSGLNGLESYASKPLYIYSEDIESESEIYRNLLAQNEIVQRMQLACLEGEECDNDELPVKTCEDNFIHISEADSASVRQESNCVFIKGKNEDLAKITDGFLLKVIGL